MGLFYKIIDENVIISLTDKINKSLDNRIKQEVEKNRLQDQQIIQQSRLAQMGEMISMIAHQWRQPLGAISSTTNNLLFKTMMDEIDKELFEKELKNIDDYSQHLSKTIDDFRNFFKDKKEKETTSLEEIVNYALDIVKISIENQNIKIKTDFNCNEKFESFPRELVQVVLNLIKNAQDILLEKQIKNPTITLQTKCNDDKTIKQLLVKDNAGGVPAEIQEIIFDPYFSTKLEKDGTGLGLYMSKIIITQHCEGELSVSNNDEGAVFMIELGSGLEKNINLKDVKIDE